MFITFPHENVKKLLSFVIFLLSKNFFHNCQHTEKSVFSVKVMVSVVWSVTFRVSTAY